MKSGYQRLNQSFKTTFLKTYVCDTFPMTAQPTYAAAATISRIAFSNVPMTPLLLL